MTWKNVIELGYPNEKIVHGEPIKLFSFEKRFANKLSIRSNEFYDSNKLGLKLEVCFEVRSSEFKNAKRVKYQNEMYEIVRTFENNKKETVELYLQKEVGD